MVLGRVDDLQPRHEAALPLLDDGEGGRDEGLRRHDRDRDGEGEDGPVDGRVVRDGGPKGRAVGARVGGGAVDEEGGLAEAGVFFFSFVGGGRFFGEFFSFCRPFLRKPLAP